MARFIKSGRTLGFMMKPAKGFPVLLSLFYEDFKNVNRTNTGIVMDLKFYDLPHIGLN